MHFERWTNNNHPDLVLLLKTLAGVGRFNRGRDSWKTGYENTSILKTNKQR